MRLESKTAIVTGGATGIGFGISRAMAEAGARVAIVQPEIAEARSAANSLIGSGFDALPVAADIRDRTQVAAMIAQTIDRWGRLDVVVNNAAVTGPAAAKAFLDIDDDLLDRTIDVNLKGTFIVSQESAKLMADAGGSIIHISSVGAYAAQEGAAVYCATKSALIGLTKAMALELAPFSIRVNCIAPGDVRTDASRDVEREIKRRGLTGNYLRKVPLARRGTPAEIGSTAVFLASDDASYITGETIVVDGGFLSY